MKNKLTKEQKKRLQQYFKAIEAAESAERKEQIRQVLDYERRKFLYGA